MESPAAEIILPQPLDPCLAQLTSDPMAQSIAESLKTAVRILVVTHHNPDGDAIGSAVAAILALEAMKKDVYGYCPGPMLAHFLDLPHMDKLHLTLPEGMRFDLTLILDCGDLQRVSDDFKPAGYVVNIDHHGTNPLYGDLNWVNPGAAATGEMVFGLINALGVRLSPGMAQALYLAIVTDTGSFRHTNTRVETFHLAGCLMQAGANPEEAARLYWENHAIESMRMRGEALSRIELHGNGRIASSYLTAEQIKSHGGIVNEPEGLSSQLRGIRGVEVGVLFTEIESEGVRISLRSHGRLDVSEVARGFGGGGHRAAAGAFLRESLETARPRVIEALQAALAKLA